jgi:hypothetical protein
LNLANEFAATRTPSRPSSAEFKPGSTCEGRFRVWVGAVSSCRVCLQLRSNYARNPIPGTETNSIEIFVWIGFAKNVKQLIGMYSEIS